MQHRSSRFIPLSARAYHSPVSHVPPYPDDPVPDNLLLSLKKSPKELEAEARLLLALKLFELGQISTGRTAELAGLPKVQFLHMLGRFGVSPFGDEPEELERDLENARR